MVSGRITSIAAALPAALDQAAMWDEHFAGRYGSIPGAGKMWHGAGVLRRHAVVDPRVEDLAESSTASRMARYVAEARPLAARAASAVLQREGLDPAEIDLLVAVSCTGYATPGLDLLVAEDVGMRPDVQRVMIGHMGCYAALPALAVAADAVAARGASCMVVCAELPSLHVQPADRCVDQLVAHSLFGDAVVAALVDGRGGGLEVVEVVTMTDREHAAAMTWTITDNGFRMGLSAKVPGVLAMHVRPVVDGLLRRHGLASRDIAGWAIHPGGPRILDVCADGLGLDDSQLEASVATLREHGNCSSATLLLVLDRLVTDTPLAPGEHVVALAFGPGLTVYAALFRQC
jgi:alkylresorcinol/alkylpyrone synthase